MSSFYGHLVPSANIGWVDGLDAEEAETTEEQNATPAQQGTAEDQEHEMETVENDGGPGRSRTAELPLAVGRTDGVLL
jgi:hypothetical protein